MRISVSTPSFELTIRPVNAANQAEIDWVAAGMRKTLIEIEGEVVGTELYSMDWLRDRVRWHVDAGQSSACVFVAQRVADGGKNNIIGHMIVRVEADDAGRQFGLVSTTYVEPAARRLGVATQLLIQGQVWMINQKLSRAATWTSAANLPLIMLYHQLGFEPVERHIHEVTKTPMVKLARRLDPLAV